MFKNKLLSAAIIFTAVLFLCPNSFAVTQEELTLTTYYPAPFGVYRQLRLFPRNDINLLNPCNSGDMFYRSTDNQFYFCNSGAWQPGGGAGGGFWTEVGNNLYPTTIGRNVGINTAAPNEKLEVNGNIRMPMSSAAAGVIKLGADRFIYSYGQFGSFNTFLGLNAGNLAMTGLNNTGIGPYALINNTTGEFNTAIGAGALRSNTDRHEHTAVGVDALASNTTGAYNTAVGRSALTSNTAGTTNTAIGILALRSNTIGDHNVACGGSALYDNNTGMDNTAVGQVALRTTTGSANVGIGFGAGGFITDPSFNTSGSNNVFIGTGARPSQNNLTNAIAIGYKAVVANSNKLVLGGTGANAVNVGINTSDPTERLDVNGGARFRLLPDVAFPLEFVQIDPNTGILYKGPILATDLPPSSKRYKKNIKEIKVDSKKILKLKPVQFQWKETGKEDIGLIAEDVNEVIPDLVIYDKENKPYGVKYDKIALYLLQMVKDLKAQNDSLKARVAALEKK